MKKTIKIKWLGFSPGKEIPYKEDFLYKNLVERYDIEISDDPDFLICALTNFEDLNYNCVKIIRTIENVIPDFNRYDYMMGFDYLTLGDRYLRFPLFAAYKSYERIKERASRMPSDEDLLNRKFCSFVVSNGTGADPVRDEFFRRLCKYKKVDSGGRHLNNIGGAVADKLEFCRGYKFNIAIENSVSPGYTTEKVMQPLAAYSVPIYYGDPLVTNDFTADCMVRIRDAQDIDRAIEEIIYLDNDDAAYLAKVKAECLVKPWDYYNNQLSDFLDNIFRQSPNDARRTVKYGYQAHMRQSLRKMYTVGRFVNKYVGLPIRLFKRITGKVF